MKRIVSLILLLTYLLILTSCGLISNEPDVSGDGADQPHVCDFVIQSPSPKYVKTRASCTQRAEYYYSCSCGKAGEESFAYGDFGGHDYYVKSVVEEFLVKEATVKTSAVYYKSCKCGKAGEETFVSGSPLQLNEDQKALLPTSLTVTLYDSLNSIYGFTYNTQGSPIDPVIQIKEVGEEEWCEYAPTSYEATTKDKYDNTVTYFISKAEITLLPNTTYVYRVCDKAVDVATPECTLKSTDPRATSFTFAHVSDSQAGADEFGRVMQTVAGSSDFVIHTGDVVQYAHYEHEWTEMLDGNYEHVMGMPMMAIAGNHETSYNNATYETVKHFNNNIPDQSSVALGYYYSFVYGDVKFIMLNTNDLQDNRLKSDQYDWLISELEGNTCKWTIVSMHNPMYSVGKYGADETRNAIALALRDQLGSVFAEYGVDLVLQAHDHAISRTFPIDREGVPTLENTETVNGVEYVVDPDGVIYVMNGPAGTQQRAPVAIDESLYAHAEAGRVASFAEITVSEDTITVTVKYLVGYSERVYYTWGIRKN